MQRFMLEFSTEGNNQIINVSPELAKKMAEIRGSGVVHLFVVGSTAALTTLEFEPGLVRHDMKEVFERIAPEDAKYDHEQTWNDDNGHSHIRSALLGPGVTIPVSEGKLLTGQWQQVVLIDFDTRPRRRNIICTLIT